MSRDTNLASKHRNTIATIAPTPRIYGHQLRKRQGPRWRARMRRASTWASSAVRSKRKGPSVVLGIARAVNRAAKLARVCR